MDECKPLDGGRGGGGGGDGSVRAAGRGVGGVVGGSGLHSFTLELNVSNSRTHSWLKLDHTVDRRAQVELKWERV